MIQYYKGGQGLSNRILVLEDEKSVNRGITFSLEKAGFEAVACGDAKEARAAVAEYEFDMLICDIGPAGCIHISA